MTTPVVGLSLISPVSSSDDISPSSFSLSSVADDVTDFGADVTDACADVTDVCADVTDVACDFSADTDTAGGFPADPVSADWGPDDSAALPSSTAIIIIEQQNTDK